MQELLIKKKRKRMDINLLLQYDELSTEETHLTIADLRKKLLSIFKWHVGKENAITPVDLFIKIYGVHPATIDLYKRAYLWNVVKATLTGMRHDDTLFIINRSHYLYVLQSSDELAQFEKQQNAHIEAIKNNIIRAKSWVKKKKWLNVIGETKG